MAPGPAATPWKSLDGYKLTTGDKYTGEDQVAFHNEGFAEYFVDFTFDIQRFETGLGAQLSHVSYLSLYLHTDKGEFVGLARSAIRGHRVWLAGFAIVPAFRSKRIGPWFLQEYLEMLRQRSDVQLVQLEVIKSNVPAFKLYDRYGFQTNYDLRDYHIENVRKLPALTAEDRPTVSTSDELDLSLPWLQQRTNHSWQREMSSLLNSCLSMKQYIVKDEQGRLLVALAVDTAKNPMRITGFAFERDALTSHTFGQAIRAALGIVAEKFEVHLEPESSEAVQLLDKMQGCKRGDEALEEHNMILRLERPVEE